VLLWVRQMLLEYRMSKLSLKVPWMKRVCVRVTRNLPMSSFPEGSAVQDQGDKSSTCQQLLTWSWISPPMVNSNLTCFIEDTRYRLLPPTDIRISRNPSLWGCNLKSIKSCSFSWPSNAFNPPPDHVGVNLLASRCNSRLNARKHNQT